MVNDRYQKLIECVKSTCQAGESLVIKGGGTKSFYGRDCPGAILDMRPYAGIVSYEPTELVITAHAGTLMSDIESALLEENQALPFEPPHFGEEATLGGMVACGLSGPRRPYTGPLRDYVLGIKCLTGKGEILTFGGQVMKNVAGYDVSRLMTGALGTLGILLEISLKILPKPEFEISLIRETNLKSAIEIMNKWAGRPLPLSAACYENNHLNIRLSGKRNAIDAAIKQLDMELHPDGLEYWQNIREQQIDFFKTIDNVLWRLSVPSTTGQIDLPGDWLIDWGGSQRWLKTNEPIDLVRNVVAKVGGYATLFKGGDKEDEIFHPLSPALMSIHKKLKMVFDPDRILNKGRMYKDI